MRLADLILTPLHLIGGLFSRLFFGRRPAEHAKLFVAREDFKYLTIKSEREGTLSPAERQMIHNVVDFRAITARHRADNAEGIAQILDWMRGARGGGFLFANLVDFDQLFGHRNDVSGFHDALRQFDAALPDGHMPFVALLCYAVNLFVLGPAHPSRPPSGS